MKKQFEHITDWVFDLDYTLYPSHCDLFLQMDRKITEYVMGVTKLPFDEARVLQKKYYRENGTTLRGLMSEHNIDPHDYLGSVHDIDYSDIMPNAELGRLIFSLPGRKHIFTNGDVPHVKRTLKALAIDHKFDGIFDIVNADFNPKPERAPYEKFLKNHNIDPAKAAMFEDMSRNLAVPKTLGMATILLVPRADKVSRRENWEHEGVKASHIDHVSDDINSILAEIVDAIT